MNGPRRKGRTESRMSRRERRALLRLLFSAAILLLTVLARILAPELMDAARLRFQQAVSAEMDVREVFSAVGRAVSGDGEGGWDGVYRAVFAPSETVEATLSSYQMADADAPCYDETNTPEKAVLTQEVLGFAFAPPVTATVSSPFGLRSDPFTGEEKFHYGIDLAAAEGTSVAAFAAGTVRTAGDSAVLGHYLIIDHDGGYSTLYAHCSRLVAAAGESVFLGETIAEVGQSGSATGPHLHFELHRGSLYLDPVYYLV